VTGDLRLVDFTAEDVGDVLAEMDQIGRFRNGWVNVHPRAEEDPAEFMTEFAPTPVPSPLGVFGRRRPIRVEGTWIPGRSSKRGEEPASVGLEHPAGRFAARQLRDAGCPVPEGWKVVVDHARRGLVLSAPSGPDPTVDHELVLSWLLRAATLLSAEPLSGNWQAEIHHR
jgi:hypothetical protein